MNIPAGMYIRLFFISFSTLLFLSCKHEVNEYIIQSNGRDLTIRLTEGKVNHLQCFDGDSLISKWPIRFPVYRFLKGDVNNDGQDDLAVGVIKSTRYDSVVRKRLFLFQIRNRHVIPLWLGSSLSHPLEDFNLRTVQDSITIVRSIEKEKNDNFLVADYEWFGFGLSFRQYIKREISLQEARTLLNN